MRALQGGNLGRNQSCRHVMCAAAKPAAHERRSFSPHFPIHECTLTFSPKHVVSNCYVIVQFISVVCSGPINTSTTTSTASSPPTTSSTAPYTSAGYHHHCDHYNNNNDKRTFEAACHERGGPGSGITNEWEGGVSPTSRSVPATTMRGWPSFFAPLVQTDEAVRGHTASFAHALSHLLVFCPFPPLPRR